MPNEVTFGRRNAGARPLERPATISVAHPPAPVATAHHTPEVTFAEVKFASSADDDELKKWKRARRDNFEIPWRSLSWMATLSFGIASFVLPDSVNDGVQWLLYALAIASFLAGFRRRIR